MSAAKQDPQDAPIYGATLSRIHHEGFGFHGDATAPGVLEWIQPSRGKPVLELGCGSGALTRHLVQAGHRVYATDFSPAMVELCAQLDPKPERVERLTLPDDPLPEVDAIVSVGHVLSYLPSEAALRTALSACARALRPGGRLALDLCDLAYGRARSAAPPIGKTGEDWALIVEFRLPQPDRFERLITTFDHTADGWKRSFERHANVLVETADLVPFLAELGVRAEIRPSFGAEPLPEGLVALLGVKEG